MIIAAGGEATSQTSSDHEGNPPYCLNDDTLVGVQVFGPLTADVITHYAYGASFDERDKLGFPIRICERERKRIGSQTDQAYGRKDDLL
jgi:hypothetical protein